MVHEHFDDTREYLLNNGEFQNTLAGIAAASAATELLLFWQQDPARQSLERRVDVMEVIDLLRAWKERTIGKPLNRK